MIYRILSVRMHGPGLIFCELQTVNRWTGKKETWHGRPYGYDWRWHTEQGDEAWFGPFAGRLNSAAHAEMAKSGRSR